MNRRLTAAALVVALAGSALVALAGVSPAAAVTKNPILGDGSSYSADPATLVDGDTLYIYAGRDEAGPTQNDFVMNEWQAFSTTDPDAGAWQHYPSLMRPEDVFAWATPGRAYAGQVVIGADGRYYWYVPVAQKTPGSADAFAIGVAVSDTALGPWTDYVGAPIASQALLGNDIQNIDPTVFTDDDGRVYMYWGTFGQLRAIELKPDMKTLVGAPKTIAGLPGFFEAPWLFKRGATYYLAYAGNNVGSTCTPAVYHACIEYATSSSPLGPWTFGGTVLPPVSSTTSHPAITEFKGRWYIVYHTADAAGGNHFRRSVAIDEVTWDDSVSPARMNLVTPTPVKGADLTPRANVAPWAAASSSNQPVPSQYWIKALNDEIVRPNPLPPDMWGNWTGTRPASEWVQYTWPQPVTVSSAEIKFWRDTAPGTGNGVSDPASWLLQYWDDASSSWLPVVHPSGYATGTAQLQKTTFDAVTTTRMRAVINAAPGTATPTTYSGVAVEEWKVNAVQPTGYAPIAVSATVGQLPTLPASVTFVLPGGGSTSSPVTWDAIDAVEVSRPGSFTVTGFAPGYAAGRVSAQVTVVGDGPTGPDTAAPTVALTVTGDGGTDGWYRSAATVRASAIDDVDLRTRIEVQIGDGAWTATDNVRFVDVPIAAEGTTALRARATDAAGNVSAVASTSVRIDATPPVVTPALNVAARTVALSASDAGSGVASVEYSLENRVSWKPYTAPVPLDRGAHVVNYRATDAAGNVSGIGSVTLPADDATPLSGNIAPLATATASYSSPWTSVGAINDGSDTAANWGTWPEVGRQWVQLQWKRIVTIDQIGALFFADSADSANGGVIPPKSWTVQYYDLATGAWVDVDADAAAYMRVRDAYNTVGFTAVSTDRVRLVMDAWGTASAGGSSGLWEVSARAAEPPADTVAPTVDVQVAPSAPASGWYATPVVLTASAADDRDASPSIEKMVAGSDAAAGWTAYDGPVTVSADGVATVSFRATDAAGNVSATSSSTVRVDRTAPVTTATVSSSADGSATAAFTAVDASSGVARTEYADGGDWAAVPAGGVVVTGPGIHTLAYRSVDVAGNVEAQRTIAVDIPVAAGPAVTAGSMTAIAGGSLALSGTGFAPRSEVVVAIHSDPIELARATTDAAGAFAVTVVIPADLAPGAHTITADGAGLHAEFALTVAPAVVVGDGGGVGGGTGGPVAAAAAGDPAALARTGVDATVPIGLALLLLVAGAALRLRRAGSGRSTGRT
ncbi:OmpL47-type beta-barrel domain-containing protein [Leifsonia sp. NPDC058194]|uniref:OmpL47-type beta-barrel domain-containing protein n=1 Tax=Leifsonia sp. NPDC058194 TaxID=3346374 RepID=UPI0036DC7146